MCQKYRKGWRDTLCDRLVTYRTCELITKIGQIIFYFCMRKIVATILLFNHFLSYLLIIQQAVAIDRSLLHSFIVLIIIHASMLKNHFDYYYFFFIILRQITIKEEKWKTNKNIFYIKTNIRRYFSG